MRNEAPILFAAYYSADETIGGLIPAFEQAGISVLVIPGAEWPREWIPQWVFASETVTYYVLVAWYNEARLIIEKKCPLAQWLDEKKIALQPRRRLWALW